MQPNSENAARHLVITVHGIRTYGAWQDRLEQAVSSHPDGPTTVDFQHFRYGYFSALAFMIPLLRWLTVRRFRRVLVRLAAKEKWDRIDIVAHSFGTHLASWGIYGLKPSRRPHIHTLILAGSVLKATFPWHELVGSSVGRVVNECGQKDNVLIVNQIFVLFTGAAGRFGFAGATSSELCNRYYDFGHSGYFEDQGDGDDDFLKNRWLPLLTRDERPVIEPPPTPTQTTGAITWLLNNLEPVKVCIYILPFVLLFLYVNGLRKKTEDRERLAIQLLEESSDVIDFVQTDLYETVELLGGANLQRQIASHTDSYHEAVFENAGALLDNYTDLEDPPIAFLNNYARSLMLRGDAALRESKESVAKDLFEKSAEMRKTIRELEPNNPRWGRNLTVSYHRLGELALSEGDHDAAENYFKECRDLMQEIVSADPASIRWRHDLSHEWFSLGTVAMEREPPDNERAVEQFGRSLELRKTIVDVDLNGSTAEVRNLREDERLRFVRNYVASLNHLAIAKEATGDSEGAITLLRDADRMIRIRLAKVRVRDWLADFAMTTDLLASLHLAAGNPDAALEQARRSLDYRRTQVAGGTVFPHEIIRFTAAYDDLSRKFILEGADGAPEDWKALFRDVETFLRELSSQTSDMFAEERAKFLRLIDETLPKLR